MTTLIEKANDLRASLLAELPDTIVRADAVAAVDLVIANLNLIVREDEIDAAAASARVSPTAFRQLGASTRAMHLALVRAAQADALEAERKAAEEARVEAANAEAARIEAERVAAQDAALEAQRELEASAK